MTNDTVVDEETLERCIRAIRGADTSGGMYYREARPMVLAVLAAVRQGGMVASDCRECGHPAGHHDAGECWTDASGREVSGNSSCSCWWYEPVIKEGK